METTSRLRKSSITHILLEEQFSLDQPPTKPLVDKSVALLMLASSNTSFNCGRTPPKWSITAHGRYRFYNVVLKSIYDFLDPIEWWFLRHQHESMLCQLSINICQLCTAEKHCVNYQQKLCQRSTKIVSNSTQRLYTKDYIIMYATTFCHLISKLSLALQITVSCCINFHELIPPPLSSI